MPKDNQEKQVENKKNRGDPNIGLICLDKKEF